MVVHRRRKRTGFHRRPERYKWFNNVEVVTARKIGLETTTYVRNIFKYYVSYKLQLEAQEAAKKAKEQVAPGTAK